MDEAEFFPIELAALQKRYEEDEDLVAVAEAVALCGWNSWPLPAWCVEPIHTALDVLNNNGERGRGTPKTRYDAIQNKRYRNFMMKHFLAHGSFDGKKNLTVDDAAEETAKFLKRQNVSARAVKASYHDIERTLK